MVILGATLAYVQEAKAGDVMKKFQNMLPPQCMVVRDGVLTKIKVTLKFFQRFKDFSSLKLYNVMVRPVIWLLGTWLR